MRVVLYSLLLLLVFSCVDAQVIDLQQADQKYAVNYPSYREDRDGTLSFKEVVGSAKDFKIPSLPVPDFLGNLSKAIWYRFAALNNTPETEWYLEIKGGYMHRLTLYQIHPNGAIDSIALSADKDFAARPVRSNNLIFPLRIDPGEQTTFYLKATSKALIRPSMSFTTMHQLYEDSIPTSYGDGFFTALAVALLLYNLFVYFSLRERVYLYYIGYIFITILHTNLVAGHVLAIFPWLDFLNTNLLLPLLAFFSVLFTNSFLQTKRYAPIIYRIRWLMMLGYTVPVLFFIAGEYAMAILATSVLMFMLFIYWLLAGILAYRNGFQPAIYYIIGFGALIMLNMTFELKIVGWVQENYWIDSALYIGSALEAIILSFALASKINFYKKEKEEIQEQAYQQAVNFSRELINMQEAERKRIASELHDSVGQKLIVIKNKILRFSKGGTAGFQQKTEELAENVADAIQEIRSISYALRPYQIDLLGLTQSIKSLAAESFEAADIVHTLHIDPIDNIGPADKQINIYRIIQECINNIVKHAEAATASVSIENQHNQLHIRIADDGKGFDAQAATGGFGLKGIRERLHILNGAIKMGKAVPRGSVIDIDIPVK
ncbi:MAG: hypothetical protein J7621_14605 [Niastella sp.]|nr:hypothetical protein [Niastella sp.]